MTMTQQDPPVGTAEEAFGEILGIATRLPYIPSGLPNPEATINRHRDRLIELVRVGLADLKARPQGELVLDGTGPDPVRERALDYAFAETPPRGVDHRQRLLDASAYARFLAGGPLHEAPDG